MHGTARARVPEQSRPEGVGAAARPPVRRHSVRGQVLDALRAALVDGSLVPGEIYSGPALGDRFGVSATPVREAMQQLALEGAVECLPNRGFRVIARTPGELAELAEVRALLEVPVLLGLVRGADPGAWAGLRPLAEAGVAAAEAGDLPGYAEADRAFHRAVLGLAGNGQLIRVADEVHQRIQWAARSRLSVLRTDAGQHVALLDAVLAADAATAQTLIHAHYAWPPH
ncbi:GntR family transcriptional regulator [Streptomyces sp. NBC_00536]|uniref:GntR family transcriptional regulator n=1 Tax=Streptomyces sp. NBC_00536 TaxID=2975769 RepID=UPI002E823196|nr:GntR family transcriptional regulator [Streptomyces sp. NBC_00536]WUC82005.1 GntR family transcriptional regulator [Streptomyces sp. NBC_00536]